MEIFARGLVTGVPFSSENCVHCPHPSHLPTPLTPAHINIWMLLDSKTRTTSTWTYTLCNIENAFVGLKHEKEGGGGGGGRGIGW